MYLLISIHNITLEKSSSRTKLTRQNVPRSGQKELEREGKKNPRTKLKNEEKEKEI